MCLEKDESATYRSYASVRLHSTSGSVTWANVSWNQTTAMMPLKQNPELHSKWGLLKGWNRGVGRASTYVIHYPDILYLKHPAECVITRQRYRPLRHQSLSPIFSIKWEPKSRRTHRTLYNAAYWRYCVPSEMFQTYYTVAVKYFCRHFPFTFSGRWQRRVLSCGISSRVVRKRSKQTFRRKILYVVSILIYNGLHGFTAYLYVVIHSLNIV
jgi:hypothetical protein